MSAFLVGYDHINALLTFAVRRSRYGSSASFYHDAFNRRIYITDENATEIGQRLLAENERSIVARYPDCANELGKAPGPFVPELAAAYLFVPWPPSWLLTPVAVLKGCSCFDYQACETEDYDSTVAHAIIDGIRSHAINLLPGYEDAPGWEFRRPNKAKAA